MQYRLLKKFIRNCTAFASILLLWCLNDGCGKKIIVSIHPFPLMRHDNTKRKKNQFHVEFIEKCRHKDVKNVIGKIRRYLINNRFFCVFEFFFTYQTIIIRAVILFESLKYRFWRVFLSCLVSASKSPLYSRKSSDAYPTMLHAIKYELYTPCRCIRGVAFTWLGHSTCELHLTRRNEQSTQDASTMS